MHESLATVLLDFLFLQQKIRLGYKIIEIQKRTRFGEHSAFFFFFFFFFCGREGSFFHLMLQSNNKKGGGGVGQAKIREKTFFL